MNIKIDNYIIKQCTADCNKFDLYTSKEVEDTKKGGTKIVETNEAYGCTIESVINRIVMDKISKNESTVDLKEFIQTYKSEKQMIFDLLK